MYSLYTVASIRSLESGCGSVCTSVTQSPLSVGYVCVQSKNSHWHGRTLPSPLVSQGWVGLKQHPFILHQISHPEIFFPSQPCFAYLFFLGKASAINISLCALQSRFSSILHPSSSFFLLFLPGSPTWPGERRQAWRQMALTVWGIIY